MTLNVLILCTGNSALSILGEALVHHWGRGRFVGYSAGSQPKGNVHPFRRPRRACDDPERRIRDFVAKNTG